MESLHNILVIGGTGRNIGKTELVCQIISMISREHTVFGAKISAIYPDETLFHGAHSTPGSDYSLHEETRRDRSKDSSRMLRAGAGRVFYLQSEDTTVLRGFREIQRLLPPHAALICESNSLSTYIKPGLFLMIKPVEGYLKPRAHRSFQHADLVITSDGVSGFPELNRIIFDGNGWQLTAG